MIPAGLLAVRAFVAASSYPKTAHTFRRDVLVERKRKITQHQFLVTP